MYDELFNWEVDAKCGCVLIVHAGFKEKEHDRFCGYANGGYCYCYDLVDRSQVVFNRLEVKESCERHEDTV